MPLYTTMIQAIDPLTGDMKTYFGPNVPGLSYGHAQQYCTDHGLGYCKVDRELVAEIPCFPGTHMPDHSKEVDYYSPGLN